MSREEFAAASKPASTGRKLIPFPRQIIERRNSEREFLPAALEIIDTPVSRAGRVMMGVVALVVVSAVAWACVGKLDIVATATGRIIPSGQIKLIQPLEIGVVKRIAVGDGDHVVVDQVLVELDPTTNTADRDRTARDIMQAQLGIARLHAALVEDPATFTPPAGTDPLLADAERNQLVAQLSQQKAKVDGLDQQVAAKQAERDEATANIAKIDASVPLLRGKSHVYEELRANQLSSVIAMLDAQRQLSDAQHDRIAATHQVDKTTAEIAALKQQRIEAEADFRRRQLEELDRITQYAAEQRQELVKATERTGRQTLRAPVSGTVEHLSVHTIGGVVTPAQTLMVIVPDDSQLEVEARLPNRDVGFVHAGQLVEIKVEAFTYTRYGLLHGIVRSVSRDALQKEQEQPGQDRDPSSPDSSTTDRRASGSQDAAYAARIALAATTMDTEQGPLPLEPGMTVTAEIKTGQRRVISYLLSPFMRYRHEALRER